MKIKFTVAEGIKIQEEHIASWAKVLKPELHQRMKDVCALDNKRLHPSTHCGLDVMRGVDLDNIVARFRNE